MNDDRMIPLLVFVLYVLGTAWCLFLTSCATMDTNTNPIETPEQRWADGALERDLVDCAARATFKSTTADRLARYDVEVRRGIPRNAETIHGGNGGRIILNGAAPTARISPWDHEGVHIGLFIETGDKFADERCRRERAFLDVEKTFIENLRRCVQQRASGAARENI